MRHYFAKELTMARENAVAGNYSLSVQKYRRVAKMVEKFISDGCAPKWANKWNTILQQCTKEMEHAIMLDQLKTEMQR